MPSGVRIGAAYFDLSAPVNTLLKDLQNAKAAAETGSKAVSTALSHALDGVDASGAKIDKGLTTPMKNASKEAGLLKSALGGIGAGISFAATTAGLNGIASGVVGISDAMVGFNGRMEQAQVGLTTILGSSSQATKLLQDLQQFAASTPFDFSQLVDLTPKLLSAGVAAKDIIPYLNGIGDAVSGMGGGAPQIDIVVKALQQMLGTGKILTGDMQQLASVGINGFALLAKQTGYSEAALRDLSSKGLLPAKEAVVDLIKGLEQGAPGAMAAQSKTLFGLLSNLHDLLEQAAGKVGIPLFTEVKKRVEELVNYLSSEGGQKAIADFAEGFGKFMDQLSKGLDGLVASLGDANRLGVLQDLGKALQAIVDALFTLAKTVATSGNPLKDIAGTGPTAENVNSWKLLSLSILSIAESADTAAKRIASLLEQMDLVKKLSDEIALTVPLSAQSLNKTVDAVNTPFGPNNKSLADIFGLGGLTGGAPRSGGGAPAAGGSRTPAAGNGVDVSGGYGADELTAAFTDAEANDFQGLALAIAADKSDPTSNALVNYLTQRLDQKKNPVTPTPAAGNSSSDESSTPAAGTDTSGSAVAPSLRANEALAAAQKAAEAATEQQRKDTLKALKDAEDIKEAQSKSDIAHAEQEKQAQLDGIEAEKKARLDAIEAEKKAQAIQRQEEDRGIQDRRQQEDRAAQDRQREAQAERAAEKQAQDDLFDAERRQINDTKDARIRALDDAEKAARRAHDAEKDALDDEKKSVDRAHDARMRQLGDERDGALKALDDQAKFLDLQEQSIKRQHEDQEQQKSLAEAERQLARARISDNPEGIQKALDDVAKARNTISDTADTRTVQDAKGAIDTQKDAIHQRYDEQERLESDAHQHELDDIAARQKALDAQTQQALDAFDKQKQAAEDAAKAGLEDLDDRQKQWQRSYDARTKAAEDSYEAEQRAIQDTRTAEDRALADARAAEDQHYADLTTAVQDSYQAQTDAVHKHFDDPVDGVLAKLREQADVAKKSYQDQVDAAQAAFDKQKDLAKQLVDLYGGKGSDPGSPSVGIKLGNDIASGAAGAAAGPAGNQETGGRPEEGHTPSVGAPKPTSSPVSQPAPPDPTRTRYDRVQAALRELADAQNAYNDAKASGNQSAIVSAAARLTKARLELAQAQQEGGTPAAAPAPAAGGTRYDQIQALLAEAAQAQADYNAAEAAGDRTGMFNAAQRLLSAKNKIQELQGGGASVTAPQTRASGGHVEPGRTYLVGENGPEPFVPDQPGYIYPHESTPYDRIGHPGFLPTRIGQPGFLPGRLGNSPLSPTMLPSAGAVPAAGPALRNPWDGRQLWTPELQAALPSHPDTQTQLDVRGRQLLDTERFTHSLTAENMRKLDWQTEQAARGLAVDAANRRVQSEAMAAGAAAFAGKSPAAASTSTPAAGSQKGKPPPVFPGIGNGSGRRLTDAEFAIWQAWERDNPIPVTPVQNGRPATTPSAVPAAEGLGNIPGWHMSPDGLTRVPDDPAAGGGPDTGPSDLPTDLPPTTYAGGPAAYGAPSQPAEGPYQWDRGMIPQGGGGGAGARHLTIRGNLFHADTIGSDVDMDRAVRTTMAELRKGLQNYQRGGAEASVVG